MFSEKGSEGISREISYKHENRKKAGKSYQLFYLLWASQAVLVVKNLPASTGDLRDTGSVPGSGTSPGGGRNSLQYSCLESPLDRGAWWATVHGVTRVRYDLATKPPKLGQQIPPKSQCHNPVKVYFLFIKVHSISEHLFRAAVLTRSSAA